MINLVAPAATDVLMRRDQVVAQYEASFQASAYLPLRKLSCKYHEGVLISCGQVPTPRNQNR